MVRRPHVDVAGLNGCSVMRMDQGIVGSPEDRAKKAGSMLRCAPMCETINTAAPHGTGSAANDLTHGTKPTRGSRDRQDWVHDHTIRQQRVSRR